MQSINKINNNYYNLIFLNLKFVVYISKFYIKYGLPFEDIVQEGNIGLLKAVKKFNPNLGIKFITFASYFIKNEINKYINSNLKFYKYNKTHFFIKYDNIYIKNYELYKENISYDFFKDYEYIKFNSLNLILNKEEFYELKIKKVYNILNLLDTRSRYIIYNRWLKKNKKTLLNLSKIFNLSIERIRQLEKNAIKNIRKFIN